MTKQLATFRIEPELDKQVGNEANRNKITKSEQYRNIVKYYFSGLMKKIFK
jgi:hypothetical protein